MYISNKIKLITEINKSKTNVRLSCYCKSI